MQGIPIGIEQRDLIAIAPTGSGKSCAYLVPLIYCLASMPALDMNNFDDGPRALVLVPTRELAIQVEADFKKLAHYTKLTSALVIGGVMFNAIGIEES
jgi:ATP-dependent RNA helicase DDX23/PRP28